MNNSKMNVAHDSIRFIAAIIADAQKNDALECEMTIAKKSVFITIKRGDLKQLHIVEELSALDDEIKAAKVNSAIYLFINEDEQ